LLVAFAVVLDDVIVNTTILPGKAERILSSNQNKHS
jgi:hypothetical protein